MRKRTRKTIRNAIEKFLAPLRPTKKFSPPIFHQILKVFHRPKFTKNIKDFFTARLCRGGHANLFRFSFQGNMRTYPRAGFRSRATFQCTLVPVFSFRGNIRQNHPFGKPPFYMWTPKIWDYHYTQNDYRTELYYFRIIFGNSHSVITEPICFWNKIRLVK